MLTSPEQMLALCDEPQVFGAKKQAQAAYDLWRQADERFVGAYQGVRAPGGSGTGFVVRLFWDPEKATPNLEALALSIRSELPIAMIRADEKATYKGRDKTTCGLSRHRGIDPRSDYTRMALRAGYCPL